MLNDEIIEAIVGHPNDSAGIVAVEVGRKFGVTLTPPQVMRIRDEQKRDSNVRGARSKASERLEEKVDLTEELISGYVKIIHDETLPIKDRLMAMRDLRGWVKLSIDTSGDVGSSNTIFEIGEEWALGFGPDKISQA